MAIKFVRIDDRLIHGQVATSWLRHVNAQQVICISDKAASNPIQQQVLQMAAPDLKVHVFGVDKFIEIFNAQPIKKSTFLIIESTTDALKLINGGVPIEQINFGGMRSKLGRIQFTPELCFSEEEITDLHTLIEKGIQVNYQIVPFDEATPLIQILDKAAQKKREEH